LYYFFSQKESVRRDITRLDLFNEIKKDFQDGHGVEVGTFKAEFSKFILENWNGTLYMVDVWNPLGNEYLDSSNHKNYQNQIYAHAMENLTGLEDRGIMIRAKSEKASEIFQDESLDFVYIDANHAYDFVVDDIQFWYSKVKRGGYLWGHDYLKLDWYNDPHFLPNKKDKHIWSNNFYHGVFGVNPAVDEFCEKNNYTPTITKEFFGTWLIQKK
jgi:hypothetical protein